MALFFDTDQNTFLAEMEDSVQDEPAEVELKAHYLKVQSMTGAEWESYKARLLSTP